jgi:hypothetical protein
VPFYREYLRNGIISFFLQTRSDFSANNIMPTTLFPFFFSLYLQKDPICLQKDLDLFAEKSTPFKEFDYYIFQPSPKV